MIIQPNKLLQFTIANNQQKLFNQKIEQNDRPLPKDRKFNSTIINQVISNLSQQIVDPYLKRTFQNTFPNTLDTTVFYQENFNNTGQPDTFIITGDINAMWLRDSMNQVFPYLPFVNKDSHLKKMIIGLINRQSFNILIDPYANAFNPTNSGFKFFPGDISYKVINGKQVPGYSKWIPERKFETDSITSLIRLSTKFYEISKESSFFIKENSNFIQAIKIILQTFESQMSGTDEEDMHGFPPYTFVRDGYEALDSLIHGRGSPAKFCGLIKQAFRPSDDACLLPFNIPANAMISVYLEQLSHMLKCENVHQNISENAIRISNQIRESIYKHGIMVDDDTKEQYFAYEIDGYGNQHFMDDANSPNLLGLPYLGFIKYEDPIYQNTRKRILSNKCQWYFQGKYGQGLGSQHTNRQYFWPLGLIMQAITSNNDDEIRTIIKTLLTTTNNTYFMHESINVNDPSQFSRSWFAWANTFFGELILEISNKKPYLLKEIYVNQFQSSQ